MKTITAINVLMMGLMIAVLSGCTHLDSEPNGRGRQLYVNHCASCHGADGSGNGPAAAALKVKPANLARIAFREGGEFPFIGVAKHIDGRQALAAHGSRDMPVWGKVFGHNVRGDSVQKEEAVSGQLLHLLTYLESIQSYH